MNVFLSGLPKQKLRKREIDLLCKLKQLNERLDQNHQDTKLAVEAERVRLELEKSLNIKQGVR